ncbi:hypothetical protein FKM82_024031 [Ascaphus truei]
MKEFCGEMKAFFHREMEQLRKDLNMVEERTDGLEKHMDAVTRAVQRNEKETAKLKDMVLDITNKQEDSENRRNNIRLRGVPEEIVDAEEFTTRWLTHLLSDKMEADLHLDRCHRALRARPQQGNPPCDIIMRFHFY